MRWCVLKLKHWPERMFKKSDYVSQQVIAVATMHSGLPFRFAMSFSLVRSYAPTAGFGRRAASGIALKYANATFSAALAKSPLVLTKVQAELNAISKSIEDSPDLKTFVSNPTLSVKDRNVGLPALYARAEGTGVKKEPVSDITKNLFTLLSENGRLGETRGVIEGFNELVAKHKGELNVTVTSAVPLGKDVLSRLEATLKQSQTAQQAKSLKLTNKVRCYVLHDCHIQPKVI
jgi:F-type H+-transporting ATPase subunit O